MLRRWIRCAWAIVLAAQSTTCVHGAFLSSTADTVATAAVNGIGSVALVPSAKESTERWSGDHDATDFRSWAATHNTANATRSDHSCIDCFLIVGVKTRAVQGFAARQRIRATWATTRSVDTRVVFLACEPENAHETHDALELEKQAFDDLLTHELGGCVDAYDRLAAKVLGFFSWVSAQYPLASYVMVADDDGYVRLNRLVALIKDDAMPRTRYYAGQVLAAQLRRPIPAMRDRVSKYFLSFDQYALSELPPFAIGAHYVLSKDLVTFLARNRHTLRPIGVLEDVSVGFWLFSLLRVRPVEMPSFRCTTHTLCHGSFVSYSELSTSAIHQIHANVVRGDGFCHDFSFATWTTPSVRDPMHPPLRRRDDVVYEWDLRMCPHTRALRLDLTIHLLDPLTPLTLPSISFSPSTETRNQLRAKLNDAATRVHRRLPFMLCDDLLDRLCESLPRDPLSKTALLALAQSNLSPPVLTTAGIKVWISHRVLRWRTFIESVMVEMFPDVQVFVVDERTVGDPTVLADPDFVVVGVADVASLPDLPPTCHRLMFATTPLEAEQIVSSIDTVVLTLFPSLDHHQWHLYVPLASLGFSDSATYSPRTLLVASSEHQLLFEPTVAFYAPCCDRRVQELLHHLQEPEDVVCAADTTRMDGRSSPETLFALDQDAARYSTAKFVLAFESDESQSVGHAGMTLIATFLAGNVPIYGGSDEMLRRVFNPKAFVHCGDFASLSDCANFVTEVHHTPELYDRMRTEPPVTNATAFYDLFSWHPDVRRLRAPVNQLPSFATRLRAIIDC